MIDRYMLTYKSPLEMAVNAGCISSVMNDLGFAYRWFNNDKGPMKSEVLLVLADAHRKLEEIEMRYKGPAFA